MKKIRSTDFQAQNYIHTILLSHYRHVNVKRVAKSVTTTMATTTKTAKTTIFHYRLQFRLMDRSFRLQMALVNVCGCSAVCSYADICMHSTLAQKHGNSSVIHCSDRTAVRLFPLLTHLIFQMHVIQSFIHVFIQQQCIGVRVFTSFPLLYVFLNFLEYCDHFNSITFIQRGHFSLSLSLSILKIDFRLQRHGIFE